MRRIVVPLLVCGCAAKTPVVSPPSKSCASAEHRQLDFWVGEWDVTIRAQGAEAKGTQEIESTLGGCAIAEHFSAEGPGRRWAGKSYSAWQPKLGKWRQTWVDDSGSYIALTGGVEAGVMTLYGEPNEKGQMRMVFKDVTATALRWEWQRSTDDWKSSTTMMVIDYKRR